MRKGRGRGGGGATTCFEYVYIVHLLFLHVIHRTRTCCSESIYLYTHHATLLGFLHNKLPAGSTTEPDLTQVSNVDLLKQFLQFMGVGYILVSLFYIICALFILSGFILDTCRTIEVQLQGHSQVTANHSCTF